MFKGNKKIICLIGIALLIVGLISVFMFAPEKAEEAPKVNIPVDKNSNIVTDGEYIFFNSPEGNIMMMHAFDTVPELWVEGWKVLSVSNTNLVLQKDKKSIAVFNREEKGIEETYDVKTDTAYCTEGAVYYKHSKTKHIMQIDRETKEEVVFYNIPVNDFLIFDKKIFIAPEEEGKGIAVFDYSVGSAMAYAIGQTVSDITFADNMVVYVTSNDEVKRLNLNSGMEIEIENVKLKSLCFSKGVYFYVEKAKGGYRLGINDVDAFR